MNNIIIAEQSDTQLETLIENHGKANAAEDGNPMRIQNTTREDVAAAWNCFLMWEKRFWASARQELPERGLADFIYIANVYEMQCFENLNMCDFKDSEDVLRDKIAFMKALLSLSALESPNFYKFTKMILGCQSRTIAPRVLGFWFWQSDMELFGAGGSRFFQGWQMNLFCQNAGQIDFADVSAILPYDSVMVRHPTKKWSESRAQELVDYVKRDLLFDGIETEAEFYILSDLLFINLISPDYGISLKGEVSPTSWLKLFRVRRAEETANACLKDALGVSRKPKKKKLRPQSTSADGQ